MDSIKKIAQKRLSKDYNKSAVDALSAFIANNPTVQYEDLVRKSLELGHDPASLIDQTLGSVLVDKNNLNLEKSSEDLLNELYSEDPTPGDRYIIDPNKVKSKKAKQVAADLGTADGVAVANRTKSRGVPDFVALRDAKTELEKLNMLTGGGHEFKHIEDWMIRPGFNAVGSFGEKGHHYGPGTYESQELTRVVRDLPPDEKVAKEIAKRTKDMPKSNFKILRALPIIGTAAAGAAALSSPDAMAGAMDMAIPGGLESLEPSAEDAAIENPQRNPTARRAALEKLSR